MEELDEEGVFLIVGIALMDRIMDGIGHFNNPIKLERIEITDPSDNSHYDSSSKIYFSFITDYYVVEKKYNEWV